MKRLASFALIGLSAVLAFSACSKNEAPQGEEVPVAANPNAMATRADAGGGGVTLVAPEGWVAEQPSSSMRKSQYRLPGESTGGDAEVSVFTGIGGSAQANIDRWVGQFSGPAGSPVKDAAEVKTEQIGKYQVTTLDVTGTFSGGMGGPMMGGAPTAQENYRMLAAVIETGQGPWFVKLIGPAGTVAKWQDSFDKFIQSING
jgi:hypothetical protein